MLLSLLFGALETRAEDAFVGAWTVSFTPDPASASAGARPFRDEALFHNKELSCDALAMYGFHTVTYNVPADAPSTFHASMTSPTQGTVHWSGRREKKRLAGVLQWAKPNGTTLQYSLDGRPVVVDDV
jgi:hypothetical protein